LRGARLFIATKQSLECMIKEFFGVGEASSLLREKEISSRELIQSCLDRIGVHEEKIHAFLERSDSVLEEADRVDARRAAGEELGPLAGIPIAVKTVILTKGQRATAGSKMLEHYQATYDATVIERLRQASAIIVGMTNTDEFAMGSSTEHSRFGPTRNPWNTTKVPGGSSGGSAAAVAAGFALAALGSDTGGSVRQPASLCGVTGLKPSYGRVSRYGLIALVSSFDQIGPFARDVEGVSLLLNAIEGQDARDATTGMEPATAVFDALSNNVTGLHVGVPKEYFIEGMDEEVKQRVQEAIDLLEKGGAEIIEISLPHSSRALAAYYVILFCEASSNLARFDGMRYGFSSTGSNLKDTYELSRGDGFGAETKRRIMLGTYALSKGYYDAYYKQAARVRALVRQDFEEAFKRVDVVVGPTSPSVAWNIGEKFEDPIAMYLSDIYTISANLAGICSLSVPCGFAHGLPVGLQLMARPFGEATVLRAGKYYQSVTDWHKQTPKMDE